MNMKFHIAKGRLDITSPGGSCYSLRATSGKGGCMNNASCTASAFEGPIPIGKYTANPKELSDPNVLQQVKLSFYGDWGDWNIPFHPKAGTNTFGRTGFYLHGGSKEGSAGCIDIGGGFSGNKETNLLKKDMLASVVINLEVLA